MAPKEYRVVWRREGCGPRTQILQTQKGAHDKVERLKRIDAELAGEIDWPYDPYDPDGPERHPLEGMPPLIEEPIIQERIVGEWVESHGLIA